jgi:uncharacterized membrane protein
MTGTTSTNGNRPAISDQDEHVVPWWWWWVIAALIAIPPVLGVVLIGSYGCQFSRHWWHWSHSQDTWGQFGDFIGGVLNPVVSWATLIAVAGTLYYTAAALRHTATATRISLNQFTYEVRRQGDESLKERQRQKEERTFRMHQMWIEPGMQAMRREALGILRKARPATGLTIYMGRYRVSDSSKELEWYDTVRQAWEFLANLHKLLISNMLDGHLASQLFGASLEPWVALNARVDLGEEAGDTTEESLDENSWFQDHVRPLGDFVKTWRNEPA